MALRRREDLRARDGVDVGRRAKQGAGSLLYTAIVVGAAVLVLSVSMRARHQWDLSSLRENSLSPQSIEVLSKLEVPVTIKAFYGIKQAGPRGSLDRLKDLYRQASRNVEIEIIDPVARPGAVRELGLDIDSQAGPRDGFAVAIRGPRKLVFRGADEESVTNAILEVASDRRRVVGIVRGYGEADPGSSADAGFRSATDALRSEYYEVRDVVLADGIPPEVQVLVLPGPRRPIPPPELDRLAAWLERGGRLLALSQPETDTGLNGVLTKFGLRAEPDRIVDAQENVRGAPEYLRIGDFTRHPVVRGFSRSLPLAMPNTGSVADFDAMDQTLYHDVLCRASGSSVGKTSDGNRLPGPREVAAASWRRVPGDAKIEAETRIVLVGGADFAINAYLPEFANRNFFLNCVGWLSQGEGLVSIRKQALAGQTLEVRRSDRPILLAALLGAPALVLAAGIAVFVRRRGL